jgi:hypothetical protein
MSAGDWFPGSTAAGSADFPAAYIKAYGGSADTIDNSSAEAFACGQVLEAVATKTGKIDNPTVIKTLHQGTWPTLLGDLSWGPNGAPSGSFNLIQWQGGKLVRSLPPESPRPSRSSRSRTGESERPVHALVQGVILGILTGGVYALMAPGQTLIFGIMKVVNLAQGAMVIMAAYLAYGLFTRFGIDPFVVAGGYGLRVTAQGTSSRG